MNIGLIKSECDDIKNNCFYTTSINTSIILEKCSCSLSKDPIKKCPKGELDLIDLWNEILKNIKETLKPEYIKYCNSEELRNNYCREILRQNWDIRKEYNKLKRNIILFENNGIYSDDTPCSLETVLGYDSTPPYPKNKKFQCPIYLCNNPKEILLDSKTCAYSINPFNKEGNDIKVYLQNICNKNYKCDYKQEQITYNYTYNSTCIQNENKDNFEIKYPGEECNIHSQCIKGNFPDIGICQQGICSGRPSGAECKEHIDCNKGLFCNGLYCQEQKSENQFCLDYFECKNYLGCLNNTCIPYFSLENGTYLNKTNPDNLLCETGLINNETNQCASLNYYNVSEGRINKDGFIECSIGEKCNYTTGYYINMKPVIVTQECSCGFRNDDKAYCPISRSVNKKMWKKYLKLLNKRYDNQCHTNKRFSCRDELSQNDLNYLLYYERETIRAHLFYNSSNCIIEILSCRFISYNKFYILLLLLAILL
jgi:hypothetical protein